MNAMSWVDLGMSRLEQSAALRVEAEPFCFDYSDILYDTADVMERGAHDVDPDSGDYS
jgi:hypothetical protein